MPASDTAIADRLDLALRLAADAAPVALRYFRSDDLDVQSKRDGTPVTRADKAVESLIRERLAAEFPYDGVLGEEHGETAGTGRFRWIIDPIDGTRPFTRGIPTFSTLIGIERAGEPVAGVMAFHALRETLWAARGEGAWWRCGDDDPRRARVSTCGALQEALVEGAFPDVFLRMERWDTYDRLCRACGRVRGSTDAYGFALVATGRAEASIDAGLSHWDAAGPAPIIEEAGGCITGWSWKEACWPRVVASNGRLHGALLGLLLDAGAAPA